MFWKFVKILANKRIFQDRNDEGKDYGEGLGELKLHLD